MKRGSVRWWLAVILLAAMTVTFIGMGRWQLGRAEQRRAIAAEIERGRHAPPVELNRDVQDLHAWQSVRAEGRWLPQFSVLLDNRAHHGRPGLWLAMPFELKDGGVVLVLRAWVPRPLGEERVMLDMKQPDALVTIQGEIATHVPRMYELAADAPVTFAGPAMAPGAPMLSLDVKALPWRQNLSLEDMSAALQRKLLPYVVLQNGKDESLSLLGQPLVHEWPEPSVDADKNMGYAMQWFMFAAIALGALLILLWRSRRRATITA